MNEEKREILEHLVEYLQDKIDTGYHKIFYNDDMYDEKTIDCINAINDALEENERLKEELTILVKDDERNRETIINLGKEIERLKDIIKEAIEYLKDYACYEEDTKKFCKDLLYSECLELLNILDTEIEIPLDENGCSSLILRNGKLYKKTYKIAIKIEEGEDK